MLYQFIWWHREEPPPQPPTNSISIQWWRADGFRYFLSLYVAIPLLTTWEHDWADKWATDKLLMSLVILLYPIRGKLSCVWFQGLTPGDILVLCCPMWSEVELLHWMTLKSLIQIKPLVDQKIVWNCLKNSSGDFFKQKCQACSHKGLSDTFNAHIIFRSIGFELS